MCKFIFLTPFKSIHSTSYPIFIFILRRSRFLPISVRPSFTMSTNTILEKYYKHNVALFLESCNKKPMHYNMLMMDNIVLLQSDQKRKWETIQELKHKIEFELIKLAITFYYEQNSTDKALIGSIEDVLECF